MSVASCISQGKQVETLAGTSAQTPVGPSSPHQDRALFTDSWRNPDEPITCPLDSTCAHNTASQAIWCCASDVFPYCGSVPTACLDSTYVAASCGSSCDIDDSTVSCTDVGADYCVTQVFSISTLPVLVTGWSCDSASSAVLAFDSYSNGGDFITPTFVLTPTAPTPSQSSPSSSGGSSTPPVVTPTTPSTPSSRLAAGAIAGIAIGAVAGIAIIAGLLIYICLQRRRPRPQPRPNPPLPSPMIQTNVGPPPNPQSPMTDPRSSYMSMPSNTSSNAPLTQANIAAVSRQPSEVAPNDSASNIHYQGSTISPTAPPTYHTNANSNAIDSPDHSGLGPLPGPQYPTGAAAFPQNTAPSVMSPGSAFGSMPPGHAPSVAPYRPPGE